MTLNEEVQAVRRHCDLVNPPMPGGCRCSYPRCYQEACAGVIKDGLRKVKETVE